MRYQHIRMPELANRDLSIHGELISQTKKDLPQLEAESAQKKPQVHPVIQFLGSWIKWYDNNKLVCC
jgi:hypothetical protein